MTSDERRELAAAEALGSLSPDELGVLEDAAIGDPSFASELEADRATVAALEARLPREAPSEDLLARIMAEVEHLEAAREPDVPATAPTRRRPRFRLPRMALPAAGAAVAVIAIALFALRGDDLGEPDAVAALAGAPAYAGVSGEAELYDDTLRVRLESAPAAPAGHHYEVWVLRDGVEAMDLVGEVAPDGEAHELRLGVTGTFAAIDISVEPDDGDPAHSGVSLAGGRFTT